ncbi:MAG: GNAT family protein [Pseudomonadota bacterium]
MAFLRAQGTGETGPVIEGERVFLRYPQAGDYIAWARLRDVSRAFLVPWEPVWPVDELTRAAFRRRMRRYSREIRDDEGYPFFVFRQADEALLGGCILSNIRRGVSQSVSLGYWVGEPHAQKGYISEAVETLLPFIFNSLRLRRVEAACLPHNVASRRLLERVGFKHEGLARQYLKINGQWQDPVLYAILAGDGPPEDRQDA